METTALTLNQIQEWAIKTVEKFQHVKSFDDIERLFLRGQGLSKNSYDSYLQAVKSIYSFTEGKHPLQWTPADIEAFYDAERSRNSISTAYARMAGLKNFCKTVQAQLPFWQSPFDIMNERLKQKLNTSPKAQQKSALYQNELQRVLGMLRADQTLKGLQTYAAVITLVTTGLRAQELCDITRGSLEKNTDNGCWYVSGIGKGNKPFRQEIHPEAVRALLDAFKAQHKRDPRTDERLLWTTGYKGNSPTPMNKPTLWARLKDIGNELKNQGEIRQSIEFSAHLFRRTFLTLLSKNGMSVRALQQHSRHSSIETLMKHYVDDSESSKPYLDKILAAV